jgi:aldehyde dehydrogenase (NAD+)
MAIVTPIETPPGPRRRLRLASPATLQPIAEIDVATAADVQEALVGARQTQPQWAALPIAERAAYLWRVATRSDRERHP